MIPNPPHQPAHILLVEDNDGDALLTEEALSASKVHVEMDRVHHGIEALAYLRRETPFEGSPRPDLILLDLNMPKMGGQELLAIIKQDPDLRSIPVVILTTSQAEQDVLRSYELHASCFIAKPVDFVQFQKIVNELGHFWFTLVKLPPEN